MIHLYDSLRIYDGYQRYSFLLRRMDDEYILYIPDKNPSRFHDKVVYKFIAREVFLDKLHDHVETIFRLNEALACTPFDFEGDTYRQYIKICTEHPSTHEVFTYLTCIEPNKSGEWVHDIRFDGAYGSFINDKSIQDITITLDDGIKVSGGVLFKPITYPSTTHEELYTYDKECTIYLASDSDVLYEKSISGNQTTYEFSTDFPTIYDDTLKLVASITYKLNGIMYMSLRTMIPVPPRVMRNIKAKKINLPDMNIYSPKILNIESPKTPDYKLQTKHVIKPLFFRAHPSAHIILHSGVNENISINLDIYKSQVKYFTIKVGTTLFKEIGRNDKGVIFKILGNMLKSGEGTYHILNQDNDLVTSGTYEII